MITCDRCHTPLDKGGRVSLTSQLDNWDTHPDDVQVKVNLCIDCTILLVEWVNTGDGLANEIDRDRHNAALWERKMIELNNAQSTVNLSTPRVWVSQGPQGLSEEQLQEALKEVRSRMEFWNGR